MMIPWTAPEPEALGFDAARLAEAVAFHRAHESPWPRSMFLDDGRYVGTASIGDRPEHAAVIGPVRARGGPNGIVLRRGRVAAEWGDTRRPDMTFSIAKSYLALLVGLAACLTRLFGRPLPDVLCERVMEPIGCSPDREWRGYAGAEVACGGVPVRSVSGGGHWGGTMFIGSRDHARMGQLVFQGGAWGGRQVLPAGWVSRMLSPSRLAPHYGLLWRLNGGTPARYASAPADGAFALGAGSNLVWVAPSLDIVAVVRWIDGGAVDGLLGRIVAADQGDIAPSRSMRALSG